MDNTIAPWIFTTSGIGGGVVDVVVGSISARMLHSQMTSRAVLKAAIYLASWIDKAITDYLLDFQTTGSSAPKHI